MSGKVKGVAGGAADAVGKKRPNLVPIPPEIWKEAVQNVSRENDPPKSPDILFECPYDRYHQVAYSKMGKHLMKCRQNYVRDLADKGIQTMKLTCKWNYSHEVIGPELLYHQTQCDDRLRIPFHALCFFGQYEDAGELKLPKDLEKLREGCFINQFIGSDNDHPTGMPMRIDDIRRPKEGRLRLEKEIQEKEEKAALTQKTRTEAYAKAMELCTAKGTSLDEEWWEDNLPSWNGLEASYDPKTPFRTYPIGLPKQERGQYEAWQKEWEDKIFAKMDDQRAAARKKKKLEKQESK